MSPKARIFNTLKAAAMNNSRGPHSPLPNSLQNSTFLAICGPPTEHSDTGKSSSKDYVGKSPAKMTMSSSSRAFDTGRTAADILPDLSCHILPTWDANMNNDVLSDVHQIKTTTS